VLLLLNDEDDVARNRVGLGAVSVNARRHNRVRDT
jgi:hypothetical protein